MSSNRPRVRGPYRVSASECADLSTGEPVEWSGYPPFISAQNDPNHIKTVGSASSGTMVDYPYAGTAFKDVVIGIERFRSGYHGGSAVVKRDPFVGVRVGEDWIDFWGPLKHMSGRYKESPPVARQRQRAR